MQWIRLQIFYYKELCICLSHLLWNGEYANKKVYRIIERMRFVYGKRIYTRSRRKQSTIKLALCCKQLAELMWLA